MGEVTKANTASADSPPPSRTVSGGRQRIISSCLTCRRRKVRCDHGHPICGACTRGGHVCNYATDQGLALTRGRVAKPAPIPGSGSTRTNEDVQSRLERLERLLEKAVSKQSSSFNKSNGRDATTQKYVADEQRPTTLSPPNSNTSSGAGVASDNHAGTLLLDDGQSQFVSSLHYALLAEEIQDIKTLLGSADTRAKDERERPTRNNLVNFMSLGRAKLSTSLQELLPAPHHQQTILDLFLTNADPVIRVTHNPTLIRRFPSLVEQKHPLSFAVFYAGVNSIRPELCQEKFGENKEEFLIRLELGVEISLAREHYLTTSNTEVLQAFVIWLTCITREDEMGKAWCLLAIAIRIALNQGLHRDPSLFPPGSMDAVAIEVRRRLWHHICHLEYRAAETKGQEPSLSEDAFTTMLPRNIEDEDIIEGTSPSDAMPYDEPKFTAMTFQLIRVYSMQSFRRIVQETYRLERNMQEAGLKGLPTPNPVQELQSMYTQVQSMLNDMHNEIQQKFLQYCNAEIPLQRLCIGLASLLEYRCYLIFWLRMPRAYRDMVFTTDMRISIFEKSIQCIETMNTATADQSTERFHWHIGGHSAFQAIMHILSELKNTQFEMPDRQRALRALQVCIFLKRDIKTKAWGVVRSMIEKTLGEEFAASGAPSESSTNSVASPATVAVNNFGRNESLYTDREPRYSQEPISYAVPQQSQMIPDMSTQIIPDAQQDCQIPLQFQNGQFNWDDMSLNSIGAAAHPQNSEMPELDWGFWGDPVNFTDASNFNFAMDPDPFAAFQPR